MEENSTKWKKQDTKLLPIMWSHVLNQNKKSVSLEKKKWEEICQNLTVIMTKKNFM